MQCGKVQYSHVQYGAVQCSAVKYSTVLCSTVRYSAPLNCCAVQYMQCRNRYNEVETSLVQWNAVQGTVLKKYVKYLGCSAWPFLHHIHLKPDQISRVQCAAIGTQRGVQCAVFSKQRGVQRSV